VSNEALNAYIRHHGHDIYETGGGLDEAANWAGERVAELAAEIDQLQADVARLRGLLRRAVDAMEPTCLECRPDALLREIRSEIGEAPQPPRAEQEKNHG